MVISLALILLLRGSDINLVVLVIWSFAELLELAFNVFIFAIIIQAILSWINPGHYNPVSSLLYSLNEPLLRPARRLIPPIQGLDLSPLVVLIALQVIKMLVIPPLRYLVTG